MSRTAGLSSVGQYLHGDLTVSWWISSVRFRTKRFKGFVVVSQCSTIWLSDQNVTFEVDMVSRRCEASRAPTNAAISSSWGRVNDFNGANLFFAITSVA